MLVMHNGLFAHVSTLPSIYILFRMQNKLILSIFTFHIEEFYLQMNLQVL